MEMLAAVRPDFALVLGRHVDMPDLAGDVIEAGIPCAIEKPAGVSSEQLAPLAKRGDPTHTYHTPPPLLHLPGAPDETWKHDTEQLSDGASPPLSALQAAQELVPVLRGGGSSSLPEAHSLHGPTAAQGLQGGPQPRMQPPAPSEKPDNSTSDAPDNTDSDSDASDAVSTAVTPPPPVEAPPPAGKTTPPAVVEEASQQGACCGCWGWQWGRKGTSPSASPDAGAGVGTATWQGSA